MRKGTTPQEIEELRNSARDGDVWLENGKPNWKGKPPEWAILFDQALHQRDEARAVAIEAVDYLALSGGEQAAWARLTRKEHPWLSEVK